MMDDCCIDPRDAAQKVPLSASTFSAVALIVAYTTLALACARTDDDEVPDTTTKPAAVSTIVSGIDASGDASVGPDGHVYLADFGATLESAGGQNIYRIAPDGSSVDTLTRAFGGASGNEFGADAALYQSDVARGEAWRVAMDGGRTRLATGLESPVGITHAADGATYVTECTADAVTRIDAGGGTTRIAQGAPLLCPNGLTLAPDGNLYAVNFRDGTMVRIRPATGAASVVATIPGGGNGHIAWANGRLYVASFRGHRIYSVMTDGSMCLIAGSGTAGNDDGDPLLSTFYRPNGVTISADGNTLYTNTITDLADQSALHPNALRRIDGLLALLDCPADRVVDND
jgi:sugar lactone lactonase YvrE